MSRRIILVSALTAPEKIKPHLRGGMWIYAGKDLNRFHAFKKCLGKGMIHASPAQFREFTISNRHAFVQWTERVHSQYGHDLIHWLSDTFSSNPYNSNLFSNFTNIIWLKNILKEYPEKDIAFVAESRASLLLADAIASENDNNQVYKYGFNKERIRFLYGIGRSILRGYVELLLFLIRYIFAYACRIRKYNSELQKVAVIVDTYIFVNSFDKKGKFINRYFSELHEYLCNTETSVGIYPTICNVPFKKFRYIFKNIYQSNTGFILLEDFLKPIDYLLVFVASLKLLSRFERVQEFSGINVQPLVNEVNWISLNSRGLISSLLIHKLPKRLCEKGISPTVFINWSENQTIHRSIISGIHKYLTKTVVIGGKPFVPPLNHLNLFNTNTERVFGFAPDRIITCGKRLKNIFSIYDKEEHYDVGASFRYGYLRYIIENDCIRPRDSSKHRIIAILLPYSLHFSRYLLELSTTAIRSAITSGWNIKIKMHPTHNKSDIEMLFEKCDMQHECVEMTNEDIESLLPKSSAVLTAASSVAIEAICLGIPVVSIGMPIGLDINMLDYLPSSMWKLAFTDGEVDMELNKWALTHPLSYEERKMVGRQVLMGFFEENTNDSVRVYMESLKSM